MNRLWPVLRADRPLQPAIFKSSEAPRRFISLRWKILFPLVVLVLIVSMFGAYLLSRQLTQTAEADSIDHLLTTSRTISNRLAGIGAIQQQQIETIRAMPGLGADILAHDSTGLHPTLEPLAAAANLDLLVIYNAAAQEVLGLEREVNDGAVDYAVATETPNAALAQMILDDPDSGSRPAILLTRHGYMLVTAAPLLLNERPVGAVMVGMPLDRILGLLRSGDAPQLAWFGVEHTFLGTTFDLDDSLLADLSLSPALFEKTLSAPAETPLERLTLRDTTYDAAYLPVTINGTPLGVLAVYGEHTAQVGASPSRQTLSLFAAGLVALVMISSFGLMDHVAGRVERVTGVIKALAAGDEHARVGSRSADEIGELGAALDLLAEGYQHKTDALQKAIHERRAETARLNAVLESVPDGLIVQDLDGRVLLLNEAARQLLGGQQAFRTSAMRELTAVVTEKLGPALAPGIYALGDPTRIPVEDKMLQAQAAAVMGKSQTRIGTVIVLRDITTEVEREQGREKLLDKMAEHAVAPTRLTAYDTLNELAQEMTRNTRTIQRLIAELRDLSTFEPHEVATGQRALPINDLLWNVAAEWQPIAQKSKVRLLVKFGPRGLHLLGDDRRLRWALGNLIDNAVKYSPAGSSVNLEACVPEEDPNVAEFIISDKGYGISDIDRPHIFTRFYRGTPIDTNGNSIRKPGTGQGLFIAQRVIEAHGGTLELESEVGVGTTVRVCLPLTAPVTLEIPVDEDEGEQVELQSGGAYDTVPLELPNT